ncbi:MAG: biotin/lipoate A/B protein ligase family protein [Elusimicrobiota bacterium]
MLRAELIAPVLDASGHMALDEAVLLTAPAGALFLRIYRWSGPACTFGYSQPYHAARTACDARGWKEVVPVRRATGGGIVFHDGDLTFSLIFPWDRTWAPDAIYKNIHRGVHVALKSAGAATSLWSPPRRPLGAAAACFTRAEPMDLVLPDGRKILGGALRKRGTKGLYQGSLRPEALALPREAVEAAVADGIAREFGAAPSTDISRSWLDAARTLDERYRSREWNERR